MAGARKDAALSEEQKAAAVAEFDFRKGIVVAILAGIFSACFAFGLAAGEPIKAISAEAGTGPLWTGLPVLCLVMFGGLVTNLIWCVVLIAAQPQRAAMARPRHGGAARRSRATCCSARSPAPRGISSSSSTRWAKARWGGSASPAGRCTWRAIIIFGTLWGFAFREWKDAAPRVKAMVWAGVGILVAATIVIGYGNLLAE